MKPNVWYGILILLLTAGIVRTVYSNPVAAVTVSPATVTATVTESFRGTAEFSITNTTSITQVVHLALNTSQTASSQLSATSGSGAITFPPYKLDPRLAEPRLADVNTWGDDVIIYLPRQADYSHCYEVVDWELRGWCVVQALQEPAEDQNKLIQDITEQYEGLEIYPLFIVNAIVLHTPSSELLQQLAQRADVQYIERLDPLSIPDLQQGPGPGGQPVNDTPNPEFLWGTNFIRTADVMEQYSLNGTGVVIGSIDSGVNYLHPQLKASYRGSILKDHRYAWYDPLEYTRVPTDTSGHGTHTTGTMIGPDIGVAPGATWVAARACSTACPQYALLLAAQWMLVPTAIDNTGFPVMRPDLRPHIVNNSWGGPGGSLWYQAIIQAWRAADMNVVFSAGNYGYSGTSNLSSPADNPGTIAVCAVNKLGIRGDFSSIGPGTIPGSENKPDICAPGVDVESAFRHGYTDLSGTSMAAPHVSGALALLRELGLNAEKAEQAILDSARPRPGQEHMTGYDHSYGRGYADVYAAVREHMPLVRVPKELRVITLSPGETRQVSLPLDALATKHGVHTYSLSWWVEADSNAPHAVNTLPLRIEVQEKSWVALPLLIR